MEQTRIRYRSDIRTCSRQPKTKSTPQNSGHMSVFKKQLAICLIIAGVLAGVAHSQADGAVNLRGLISNNLQYSVNYNVILTRVGDIYSALFRHEVENAD